MSETQPSDDADESRPVGLRRVNDEGKEILDALAGRSCLFGFGFDAITDAIAAAAENYLGDPNQPDDDRIDPQETFLNALRAVIGDSTHVAAESAFLCASADEAVETAIGFARRWKTDAYRTIALIGSDHGRTAASRTASGRPELHHGYGPMMAGFAHVPANDIDALRATVDPQTACLLVCPVDLHDAARPLTSDFLQAARELCDQNRIALIVDESRLSFGSSGEPFVFSSIADIKADGVVLSAGLFGGMSGGIFVGAQKLTQSSDSHSIRYPMQRAAVLATLSAMKEQNLPQSVAQSMQDFAVALAERIGGFEFVRDVLATGTTIGIDTDIASDEIVRLAAHHRLRIESAGDTAVRIQLPINVDQQSSELLIERFGQTMEQLERETAEALNG
ncbi:MAG: aminotransferase class III-fold pyridoxal phosphate-dependent enzyme [Pirellulaceae bacterium]|nr:aminotransferase class III-fold pyridoxal phosphate-dependent enzyme [Pirellulaceae bacterium]